MLEPEIPVNETERLAALCDLNVLDTAPEERFDRLTRLAKCHFDVPIALVSLIDSARQWFKSRQGLDATETPRNISFCGHAILAGDILCVPNALLDPRFADNPLVTGGPKIRFYAGAPLHSPEGLRIGTLCIIDDRPRDLSRDQLSILRDLADGVESELARTRLLHDQAALFEQKQRLQHLIELSPGVIYSCHPTGDFSATYISEMVESVMGYSPQQFLGDPSFWSSHIYPGDRERVLKDLERTYTNGEHQHEYRFLHADGRYRWIQDNLRLVRDKQGQPVEIVGLWLDISERKAAERIQQQYASIIESSDDAIISKSLEGVITNWNPAAQTIFGYTAEEAIGQPVTLLVPTDYIDEELKILARLRNGERIPHVETQRIRKDGRRIDILATLSPLKDDDGGIVAISTVARDVTEHKRAEEGLRDREARLQAILDNVVDGIITIDVMGIVEALNPAAEKLFGYAADEVCGNNIKMLMPEPYRSQHDGYLHNYNNGGERKIIGIGREVEGQRKDGVTFPMELAVGEMMVNGKRMFTGIVRDITERKKAERMKSEFVSTVSHELRTPLTSIRGALGLVLGKTMGELSPKAYTMLEMANRNSERLTLLINDLLDLEKIESGHLAFEFKRLDLIALTGAALAANEEYARQHQVTLTFESALPCALVWGDEHRLLQVFANLISNAVKYSPPQGVVQVSVCRNPAEGYRVSIRDTGSGIPDEFRSHIFQRFAQADSSDTREKGGTGLGLSVSKAIVEQHNGHIDYATETGVGTEFYFDLPEWFESRRELENVVDSRPRVLICEDNIDVAEILAELLSQEGIDSDIATSAASTERMLAQYHYRLLLLDLSLPDADGLMLLRQLREAKATRKLPIIVVSGRANEGRLEFSREAINVVDWLQKPVDKARLERALQQALRGSSRARVLHVEDDPDIIQVTQALLEDIADYDYVGTVSEARRKLAEGVVDLVILDLTLIDGSGLELLDELKGRCPVVIFSGQETGAEVNQQVAAALTKSKTSNEQLLNVVKRVMNKPILARE